MDHRSFWAYWAIPNGLFWSFVGFKCFECQRGRYTGASEKFVKYYRSLYHGEWQQGTAVAPTAEEAITHATYGRCYYSSRVVFRMQARLMAFASEAFRKVLIPGYRFLPTKNRMPWGMDREIKRGLVRLIGRRSGGDSGEEDETTTELKDKQDNGFNTRAIVLLAVHPDWQDRTRGSLQGGAVGGFRPLGRHSRCRCGVPARVPPRRGLRSGNAAAIPARVTPRRLRSEGGALARV
uniref:Uncharacterized protein n=1 Tax=Oryza rufipogon TaxID=4529 RepID=A0A0E0NHN1_ORYRU